MGHNEHILSKLWVAKIKSSQKWRKITKNSCANQLCSKCCFPYSLAFSVSVFLLNPLCIQEGGHCDRKAIPHICVYSTKDLLFTEGVFLFLLAPHDLQSNQYNIGHKSSSGIGTKYAVMNYQFFKWENNNSEQWPIKIFSLWPCFAVDSVSAWQMQRRQLLSTSLLVGMQN